MTNKEKLKQDRCIYYSNHLKEIKRNLDRATFAIEHCEKELVELLANRSKVVELIKESQKPLNLEFDVIQADDRSKELWIKANGILNTLGTIREDSE